MASTKKAFGQFVTVKRKAAGLTQLGLAERLFVTESAVSKWERGVSYPDISLVAPLAQHLGVSEGELIQASDDVVAAQVGREARFYRRWRSGVLRTTAVVYSVALATCFIVNLAVNHTLSWFWVVLASVAVAFSLTTLPLLVTRHRALISVGAFLVSLFGTFTVAWATNGGGPWLAMAIAAVLLAVSHLVVERITSQSNPRVNLGQWRDPYIAGNVLILVLIACLAIAAILSVTATVQGSKDT